MAYVAVRSKAEGCEFDIMIIVAPIVFVSSVFGPRFVM